MIQEANTDLFNPLVPRAQNKNPPFNFELTFNG